MGSNPIGGNMTPQQVGEKISKILTKKEILQLDKKVQKYLINDDPNQQLEFKFGKTYVAVRKKTK